MHGDSRLSYFSAKLVTLPLNWLQRWTEDILQNNCNFLWQFLPARRYATAGNSHGNVSVRLSVTSRYCVKTKKASVMISSPSRSPMILVFWRQISSPNSKGFPRGLKEGWGRKFQRFYSCKRQCLENGSRYGYSYK